jgi:hypothetical protein
MVVNITILVIAVLPTLITSVIEASSILQVNDHAISTHTLRVIFRALLTNKGNPLLCPLANVQTSSGNLAIHKIFPLSL